MTRYLISDLHLGHTNIIEYCNRPFSSVEEMDESIIRRWNQTLTEGDQAVFLGDLCMTYDEAEVLAQLEELTYGSLIFIEGNHDPVTTTFDSHLPTRQYHYLEHDDWQFCLTHYPEKVPQNWQGWVIHGHTHNNKLERYPFVNPERKTVNVSAELLKYTPISVVELIRILETQERYETIASVA